MDGVVASATNKKIKSLYFFGAGSKVAGYKNSYGIVKVASVTSNFAKSLIKLTIFQLKFTQLSLKTSEVYSNTIEKDMTLLFYIYN